MEETTIPTNFASVINDFAKDLAITFPEYSELWQNTISSISTDDEIKKTFEHCKRVYPERFFDILYQNDDIFSSESTNDVHFLPNIDFKILYNAQGLSENTKKTIWKYLQLVLFTVIGEVQDKNVFGDTMNVFDGVDEKELHEKLSETMNGLTDFFKNMENISGENTEQFENMSNEGDADNKPHFNKMEGMPNMDNIQDHLTSLFNGKIGSLAKEMAEEISGDFADLIGDNGDEENPQDVLKKLMQNPKKIMDLMKSVGGKLDAKMQSGEISREEIMKEAGDLVGKMKDMGGNDELNDMFKKMAKGMGGMGGLAGLAKGMGGMGGMGGLAGLAEGLGGMGGLAGLAEGLGGMGGLGKNVKLDTNAIDRMNKTQKLKENAKKRMEIKQLQQQVEHQAQLLQQQEREKIYNENQRKLAEQYSLMKDTDKDKLIFRINGEEQQEKSFINPVVAKMIEDEDKERIAKQNNSQKKKKKKNKK